MATYVNLSKEDERALYTVKELFDYFNRFHRGATFSAQRYEDITPEEMETAARVINFLNYAKNIEVK